MVDQVAGKPDGNNFVQHIALITGILLLPGLQWALLGWLHGLIPLVSFYYLYQFGNNVGRKFLLTGAIISLTLSIFTKTLPEVLFSLSLIPGGYIVAHCARRKDTVMVSGLKATATLLLSWAVYYMLLSIGSETSGYAIFLQSLDKGVTEAIALYKNNESLTLETQIAFEQSLRSMQNFLPKILPALFTSAAVFLILLAMASGNYILLGKSGRSPWPKYQLWQLPEQLIWIFISSAAIFIIAEGFVSIIGVNLLIVLALLYCIQGFAIVIYFFTKWDLPRFVRIVFFFMILFQTVGTVILLGLGLWNTWVDFRKLKITDQVEPPSADTH